MLLGLSCITNLEKHIISYLACGAQTHACQSVWFVCEAALGPEVIFSAQTCSQSVDRGGGAVVWNRELFKSQ